MNDLVVFLVATLVALFAVGYNLVMGQLDELKANWIQ